MPTKNPIELGAGTLYMKPLEGGDPVQLGEVTPENIIEPGTDLNDLTPGVYSITNAPEASFTIEMEPGEAWERFQAQFIRPVAEAYRQYIRDLAAAYVAWCLETHPDWVHILRRTKKKRTRKKYNDRLRRAFLEEVNHG